MVKLAAGAFLAGATSRLLPASIPLRFFGAAVASQLLAWLALPDVAPAADAARPRVAVIYPQVREPYRAVFHSITEGITAGTGAEPGARDRTRR